MCRSHDFIFDLRIIEQIFSQEKKQQITYICRVMWWCHFVTWKMYL